MLAILALALMPAATAPATFSHQELTAVLERFVDERGLVDYRALSRDRGSLDAYLVKLARWSPDSSPALFPTGDDRLAYWINAYNALVIAAVLDRGVDTPSVWGDGFFGIGFFTRERGALGGRRVSLKELEDEIIRGRFRDPRVHAALNCASRGCPRLPRKAFGGATLPSELDAAMREFVSDERHCRVDTTRQTVWLSKIFDWFEKDFLEDERARGTARPSLIGYVNRFRAGKLPLDPSLRVRFSEYDKGLNSR